jgi:hypothetical protein
MCATELCSCLLRSWCFPPLIDPGTPHVSDSPDPAAARQSVRAGNRQPHPIRKNVGATVSASGQLFGTTMAARTLNRNPSAAWRAQ